MLHTVYGLAQNTPQSHKIYDRRDGFLVEGVNTMLFDNDGWLWIAGSRSNTSAFKLKSRQAVLQRYNGSSFHTIPIPELDPEEFYGISIKKRQDGQMYIQAANESISKLFLLNPKTLDIQEVALPPSIKKNTYYEFSYFPYKDYFIVFISNLKKSYVYRLHTDLSFEVLHEIPERKDTHASHFFGFEDHFIINDGRSGVLTFTSDGLFKNVLQPEELGLDKTLIDYTLSIQASFTQMTLGTLGFLLEKISIIPIILQKEYGLNKKFSWIKLIKK